MICPNCRKPGASIYATEGTILVYHCRACKQRGRIGAVEIDKFMTEIKNLKAEIADLNRLASDGGA